MRTDEQFCDTFSKPKAANKCRNQSVFKFFKCAEREKGGPNFATVRARGGPRHGIRRSQRMLIRIPLSFCPTGVPRPAFAITAVDQQGRPSRMAAVRSATTNLAIHTHDTDTVAWS
jgi:hypothetical protein